jgi:hypothetical protein
MTQLAAPRSHDRRTGRGDRTTDLHELHARSVHPTRSPTAAGTLRAALGAPGGADVVIEAWEAEAPDMLATAPHQTEQAHAAPAIPSARPPAPSRSGSPTNSIDGSRLCPDRATQTTPRSRLRVRPKPARARRR